MSYANESKQALHQRAPATAMAHGVTDYIRVLMPYQVLRVGLAVGVLIETNPLLVTFTWPDSSTTVVTVPVGTAAGKVCYKNVTPHDLNPGDSISIVGSGTTGSGIAFMEVIPRPETPANLSSMLASA